ncbi:MAG: hypothetical protein ACI95S_001371, partial [Dinoroseobacter sp.]
NSVHHFGSGRINTAQIGNNCAFSGSNPGLGVFF